MLATPVGRLLLLDTPFSPKNLPGLKLWLRSDQGVQAKGASQFTAASSQSLSVADNAALSSADVDLWFAGWVYLDSTSAVRTIASKWQVDSNNREWLLYFDNSNTRFKFIASPDGTGSGLATATASTFGAPSTVTWYFVMAYHDAAANTIGISVNGGAFDTAAHTTGLSDKAGAFRIGAYFDGAAAGFMDGRVAHSIFGKSPVGGGAALWTTIRDALYNGGSGLDVGALSSAQQTAWGVVSAWRLQEGGTGTRADSFGGNTLTNNNSVSGADGPFYVAAIADDPVARHLDQSGQGNHPVQATASKRPLFKTGIVNGLPVLRYDGSDDFLKTPVFGAALAIPFTTFHLFKVTTYNADGAIFGDQAFANAFSVFTANAPNVYLYNGIQVNLGVTNTSFHALGVVWNDASSQRALDASAKSATAIGSFKPTLSGASLGASTDGTGPFAGDQVETIVCSGEVSADQFAKTMRYLGRRALVTVS